MTCLLVERGYVELNQISASKSRDRQALKDAEEKAIQAGLGVWSEAGKRKFRMEYGKSYQVALMDIWDPVTVVLQLKGKELTTINQLLPQAKIPATKPMKGDFLAAIYEGKIYRVIVKNINVEKQEAECEYVELCILEWVPFKDLRILPQQLASIPPQAFAAKLACCKEFKIDENFKNKAMDYIFDLVGDGALYAHLIRNGKLPEVLLTDSDDINSGSVNSMVLSEGWVHFQNIDVDDEFIDIVRDFEDIEAEAQKDKKGAWAHGIIAGNDDEDEEDA